MIRWNDRELTPQIYAHLRANLERACIIVQRAARANTRTGGLSGLHRRSGQLVNSIRYEIEDFEGRVGSNLRYARIHEIGGKILPKNAGALAVPVHPDARNVTSPRSIPGLRFVARPGKAPLLVRDVVKGKGKKERAFTEIMFVLMKSVTIPARPYLRPAVWNNAERIRRELARPMRTAQ